jgi:hypothetical protein
MAAVAINRKREKHAKYDIVSSGFLDVLDVHFGCVLAKVI